MYELVLFLGLILLESVAMIIAVLISVAFLIYFDR